MDANQDGFTSLFARLAASKGNSVGGTGSGGPPPKTSSTTPNVRTNNRTADRSERTGGGAKPKSRAKRRAAAADDESMDDADSVAMLDEEDAPLSQLSALGTPKERDEKANKRPRNSNEGRRSNPEKRAILDDEDDMTQDDKQTLDRFAGLVLEAKDMQGAPLASEDGQFNQWLKDCGPNIFRFFNLCHCPFDFCPNSLQHYEARLSQENHCHPRHAFV